MRISKPAKVVLALVLTLVLAGGGLILLRGGSASQTRITAYFDNSNGIYVGDDVVILGVRVGKVEKIEPQPQDAKITFVVDGRHRVPAEASAVIMSPTLVSARVIALTPAYTGGPELPDGGVIPRDRTAVPVEYDDLREQLEKLTETLQPTEPGEVSTLGAFINTAADNVRGQGANIREALIQVSQAFSILGDHSDDVFGTVKNLNTLVTALQTSTDLMSQLNGSLASVTGLLANDPAEIANAVQDLYDVIDDADQFLADNVDAISTTSEKAASVTQALGESIEDLKQTLHIAPSAIQNFVNIYEPSNASLTGALAVNQFANPVGFLCSAIQAAARMGGEEAAKLCVQYLAPIMKNRQFNFPPLGVNPFVGATARPNEVTFSEDWLRPLSEAGRVRDFYEGPLPVAPPPAESPIPAGPAQTAAAATPTDPAAGLPGLMLPTGGNP